MFHNLVIFITSGGTPFGHLPLLVFVSVSGVGGFMNNYIVSGILDSGFSAWRFCIIFLKLHAPFLAGGFCAIRGRVL